MNVGVDCLWLSMIGSESGNIDSDKNGHESSPSQSSEYSNQHDLRSRWSKSNPFRKREHGFEVRIRERKQALRRQNVRFIFQSQKIKRVRLLVRWFGFCRPSHENPWENRASLSLRSTILIVPFGGKGVWLERGPRRARLSGFRWYVLRNIVFCSIIGCINSQSWAFVGSHGFGWTQWIKFRVPAN